MSSPDKKIYQQARWLSQALVVSSALNIGLLLALFFLVVKDSVLPTILELRPVLEEKLVLSDPYTNADELAQLDKLHFDHLLSLLNDKTFVEDGFMKRDLSLGVLVSKHDFDINKALFPKKPHPRILSIASEIESASFKVRVFPGLNDEDFDKMIHFAKLEKWPITSEGMFRKIQENDGLYNTSLLEAFYLTPHFLEVETLFQRADFHVERKVIMELLVSGNWQMLDQFYKTQLEVKDLSLTKHQQFLLDYIELGSKSAANLLLKMHGAFAAKKLNDDQVKMLFNLLDEKNVLSEAFAKAILLSPRSDSVWMAAAAKLYSFEGTNLEEPYDHTKVLKHFISEDLLQEKIVLVNDTINKQENTYKEKVTEKVALSSVTSPKGLDDKKIKAAPLVEKSSIPKKTENMKKNSVSKIHVVLEGETLWMISRKYQVELALLKTANKLSSDKIKKGQELLIP